MDKFSEVFEKYFPQIAIKNEVFRSIMIMIKSMLSVLNRYVDDNITKDI